MPTRLPCPPPLPASTHASRARRTHTRSRDSVQATSAALKETSAKLAEVEGQAREAQQALAATEAQVRELETQTQQEVAVLMAERATMLDEVETTFRREMTATLMRERETAAKQQRAAVELRNKEIAVSLLNEKLGRNEARMRALEEQTAAAREGQEEAVRLAKQSVADELNVHLENEKAKLQVRLWHTPGPAHACCSDAAANVACTGMHVRNALPTR